MDDCTPGVILKTVKYFITTMCGGVREIFIQNIVTEKKAYFFLDKQLQHTYTFQYWW
jgi:hypothetical protein